MTAFASGNDLHTDCSPANSPGGTSAAVRTGSGVYGPALPPPDLLAFAQQTPVAQAAQDLGLARKTVYRLRQGYWPSDSRKILSAWAQFRGRTAQQASSWFLRRVHVGGVVRHAGREFTAHGLAARTGELLAVARTAGGGLLVQTLELPTERLPLAPVDAPGRDA